MKNNATLLSFLNEGMVEAGCDEAYRGPLAGPVYAAAVILPEDFRHPLLDDSKKMTEKERDILRPLIEKEAVAWSVQEISAEVIDSINILNASIAGMWRAVMSLSTRPEHLLIDGNRFRGYAMTGDSTVPKEIYDDYKDIPHTCVIKGDGKYACIAAASVLAKTYRDEYMRRIAIEYPQYGWDRNMGYPTKTHVEAIRKYGYTPYHRKSFHLKELEPTLF